MKTFKELLEELSLKFSTALHNSNETVLNQEIDNLSEQLYHELKNKMYDLVGINSQKAFIKETLTEFNYFDSFYTNRELINSYCNSELMDEDFQEYLKKLTPKEDNILSLYSIFEAFIINISDLCYFFEIDLNEIVKEHIALRCSYTENDMFALCKWNKTERSNKRDKQSKQITFKDLFQIPYNSEEKQTELKELLRNNEYIDDCCQWRGHTTKKNELAFLFHYLKDTGILQHGNFEPQIKTFYKEFGLTVYNDKEPQGYCHKKNLVKYNRNSETYSNFQLKFSEWIK